MIKSTYLFGSKLRTVREKKGITLKQVARAAGITESMVSQIERNKVSPSVETLFSISDYLDIDYDYLFRDIKKARTVSLVPAEKGNRLLTESCSYTRLSLMPGQRGEPAVECVLLEVKPGMEKGSPGYGHQGSETGIIIEGEASLLYGTEEYRLSEGDSISFSSDTPHILKNTGGKDLKAVWVISPPKIFFNNNFTEK